MDYHRDLQRAHTHTYIKYVWSITSHKEHTLRYLYSTLTHKIHRLVVHTNTFLLNILCRLMLMLMDDRGKMYLFCICWEFKVSILCAVLLLLHYGFPFLFSYSPVFFPFADKHSFSVFERKSQEQRYTVAWAQWKNNLNEKNTQQKTARSIACHDAHDGGKNSFTDNIFSVFLAQ